MLTLFAFLNLIHIYIFLNNWLHIHLISVIYFEV